MEGQDVDVEFSPACEALFKAADIIERRADMLQAAVSKRDGRPEGLRLAVAILHDLVKVQHAMDHGLDPREALGRDTVLR